MEIGYLEATKGNNGIYFIGALQLMGEEVIIAMGKNPLKDTYDGASDFEFRMPGNNWNKAGNASTKTAKSSGNMYIKGAITQQGVGTVYVNLYEVYEGSGKPEKDDKKPVLSGYNVHYTGDSVANARRNAFGGNSPAKNPNPATGGSVNAALGGDKLPY